MKRLGRIAFSVLAALSLLLCMATAMLWVRSYFVADILKDNLANREIGSTHGRLVASWSNGHLPITINWRWTQLSPIDVDQRLRINGFHVTVGFAYYQPSPMGIRGVMAPHWAMALLFAVLPTIQAYRRILFHRRCLVPTSCVKCGYDLRATPDRCPECG